MTDNRRFNMSDRNNISHLSFVRYGKDHVSIEADDGDVEIGMRFSDADLARLRTWLNTGISPSRIDLVDPVPDVVIEKSVATFDPQPRDLRSPDMTRLKP